MTGRRNRTDEDDDCLTTAQIIGRIKWVTKTKISATVDPERLQQARELTGMTNLSRLLDEALQALVERTQEQRWLDAHADRDLPDEVPVDLTALPWNET